MSPSQERYARRMRVFDTVAGYAGFAFCCLVLAYCITGGGQ